MSWNKEGKKIFGLYMSMKEYPFFGTVIDSRVGYGKNPLIHHLVVLDEPMLVYGEKRDSIVVVKGRDLFSFCDET